MADTIEEFLKGIAPEETNNLFDKPLVESPAPEKEDEEKEEAIKKNRYARRREAEAQRLRDENLQLNERVKVLSELGKFKEEVGDDPLKKVDAIFGTDTPEKLAATNILKEALAGMKESAKSDVIKEWESRTEQETTSQKEADSEVDDFLDHVEEEHGLDMSDDNVRSGYLTLMEKMSSKYNDGNIKEFADPDAVAETYIALQKRQGSGRARELADRSMTRSGESQPSTLPQNAIDRFMEEQGLGGSW